MSLNAYADVVITADSVSPSRQGFGIPLILSSTTATAGWAESYREYTRQAEVLVDFTADSPEALAAGAMFGQNPRPQKIFIGKCTLPPTMVYRIDVLAVRHSHTYKLNVKGKGVTATQVTYTSDANATTAEICAGLLAQLNLVVGNNYLASGGVTEVTVTADAAGGWFSIESVDTTALGVRQTQVDPGVATDLGLIITATDAFYYVYTTANSQGYAEAVATWCQSNRRFYMCQIEDTRDLGTSTGTAGLGDILAASGRTYVATDYHPAPNQMSGAALIGNIAPRTPGSWTAVGKRRTGVTPVVLTPSQRSNLVARFMNFYEKVAGVSLSAGGTTTAGPSDTRGFIDNVVSLDWQENDMEVALFALIAGAPGGKIPRTDEGRVAIEGVISASLKRGIANGVINELGPEEDDGPSPNVTVPALADMEDLLPRGMRATFDFKLAGAVHNVNVTGVVVL